MTRELKRSFDFHRPAAREYWARTGANREKSVQRAFNMDKKSDDKKMKGRKIFKIYFDAPTVRVPSNSRLLTCREQAVLWKKVVLIWRARRPKSTAPQKRKNIDTVDAGTDIFAVVVRHVAG